MGELEKVGERTVGDFGVAAPRQKTNGINFSQNNATIKNKIVGLINSERMKAYECQPYPSEQQRMSLMLTIFRSRSIE